MLSMTSDISLSEAIVSKYSRVNTCRKLHRPEAFQKLLNSATYEFDQLIKDVKERPGRYIRLSIFGKKDTK